MFSCAMTLARGESQRPTRKPQKQPSMSTPRHDTSSVANNTISRLVVVVIQQCDIPVSPSLTPAYYTIDPRCTLLGTYLRSILLGTCSTLIVALTQQLLARDLSLHTFSPAVLSMGLQGSPAKRSNDTCPSLHTLYFASRLDSVDDRFLLLVYTAELYVWYAFSSSCHGG